MKSAWKRADALRSSGFDAGDVSPRGDDPPLMQQWSGRPFAHRVAGGSPSHSQRASDSFRAARCIWSRAQMRTTNPCSGRWTEAFSPTGTRIRAPRLDQPNSALVSPTMRSAVLVVNDGGDSTTWSLYVPKPSIDAN